MSLLHARMWFAAGMTLLISLQLAKNRIIVEEWFGWLTCLDLGIALIGFACGIGLGKKMPFWRSVAVLAILYLPFLGTAWLKWNLAGSWYPETVSRLLWHRGLLDFGTLGAGALYAQCARSMGDRPIKHLFWHKSDV